MPSSVLKKEQGRGPAVVEAYKTTKGRMYHARIEDALASKEIRRLQGKVDLILTSPPFPLVRKKKYGNASGEAYIDWLCSLAVPLSQLLSETGSLVLEIGNAWEPGVPVMSTLPLEALLAFKKAANLQLCQHVICQNPARLPGPAEWVSVKRIRLKDSFTHVWWMSRSANPNADNKRVLSPYSSSMKSLLRDQHYNSGSWPAPGFVDTHLS
jgi:site-specific DNA-methyltransferase (cytosine-N4-specific)